MHRGQNVRGEIASLETAFGRSRAPSTGPEQGSWRSRRVPSSSAVASPLQPRSLELSALRMEAGLSPADLASFLGRTERTLRRWKAEGIPDWARTLLQLRGGYLDALGWSGWRLLKGELYAPDLAVGFRREDLYAAHWNRQRLRALGVQGAASC